MKKLTYEGKKKTAQKIVELLDGLEFLTAKEILALAEQDALRNSFIELKNFEQTINVNLVDADRLDALCDKITEIDKNLSDDCDETGEKDS